MSLDDPAAASAPLESGRGRGEGRAMQGVVFRDPPDLEATVAELQLEIARTLVKAPVLPVELPAFDLNLLSVSAERAAIDLVLGKSEPIVKLRLKPIAPRPAEGGRTQVVEAASVALHPSADRYETALERMGRRLEAAISVDKWQAARGPANRLADLPVGVPMAFYRQLVPGVDGQALVRVGFRCNQNCGICWQDRDWGRFGSEQVLTWIEDLYAAGARSLILSGGEPTLDGALDQYLRRARELGFSTLTLETNAVRFAKPGLAEHLRDAGLSDCFVSLHSADAATSDAITRAPGTFERTVAGIKALMGAGVPVRLNCVLTREGLDHIEGLPDFVAAELAADACFRGLMLSQPSDPFDARLLPEIIPEPDRLRGVLARVIDRCFALGIEVSGLDGPCGPPLCAFAADPRIASLTPVSEELDSRVFLAACGDCAVRPSCFGARRADVDLYGDRCVVPLAADPRG